MDDGAWRHLTIKPFGIYGPVCKWHRRLHAHLAFTGRYANAASRFGIYGPVCKRACSSTQFALCDFVELKQAREYRHADVHFHAARQIDRTHMHAY